MEKIRDANRRHSRRLLAEAVKTQRLDFKSIATQRQRFFPRIKVLLKRCMGDNFLATAAAIANIDGLDEDNHQNSCIDDMDSTFVGKRDACIEAIDDSDGW